MRWPLLALAALLAAPPAVRAEDTRPAALREIGFDQHLDEAVPLDLQFKDETGRSVKLGDYFHGLPVALSLVYYECPMLCTISLNGLASALGTLTLTPGQDFELVTVSFEPKEKPELAAAKKKAYVKRYGRAGAERGWHFLTGDAEAVSALTKAVGFRYTWDERTKQYAHPTGVVVLTPEGRIARYLFGVEYTPKDLRFALVESSAGRIGTPIDQLALYCYQYDPMTGKYGMLAMRLVRVAGALTVIGLGGFILMLHRRERRAAAAHPVAAAPAPPPENV